MKTNSLVILFALALSAESCIPVDQVRSVESGASASYPILPITAQTVPAASPPVITGAATPSPSPTSTATVESGPPVFTSVTAGWHHTCGLADRGGVKCWGRNEDGQLGDGTTEDRMLPVDVYGLTGGVKAIDAGAYHTCALTADGVVTCWGKIPPGLHNGSLERISKKPMNIPNPTGKAAAVTAGVNHTCFLTESGGVKCWGYNSNGQLGDGSNQFMSETPVDVAGLTSGVKAIAAGDYHTCALTETGGVKCWGLNIEGQLGDGSNTHHRSSPVDVVGLTSGVKAVASGDVHTCAVPVNGSVQCWGLNYDGLLGGGMTEGISLPVTVAGLTSGATAVTAGDSHTCALMEDGGVKCWGSNPSGVLGDATSAARKTPADVVGLNTAVAVSAGHYHTCALTAEGKIMCWGLNLYGQLGDGTKDDRAVPVLVGVDSSPTPAFTQSGKNGSLAFTQISAGVDHTCALTDYGRVKCWGRNWYGQLGDGTDDDRKTPVDVLGLTNGVAAVDVGQSFSCALTTGGGVQCWGRNSVYQLGDGWFEDRATPADVSGLTSGVLAISVGWFHACALTESGGIKCWGSNGAGQLGDGTHENRRKPVEVLGLASGAEAVAAGVSHTCALLADGGVKCWGTNWQGQLGDGTTKNRITPADVIGLADPITAIAAGADHTCALTANGGVKCWGWNYSSQLGDGTFENINKAPVEVLDLARGVVSISAGRSHACAIRTDGRIMCWGNNDYGQLGDGLMSYGGNPPVFVHGISGGAIFIAAGEHHTCALTADGGAKCWGWNEYGQLGDGTTADRNAPVDVVDEF